MLNPPKKRKAQTFAYASWLTTSHNTLSRSLRPYADSQHVLYSSFISEVVIQRRLSYFNTKKAHL